ncbi:MAG: hypothetical protein JSU68_13580 [Phycisphaerales bacterium]|nr:MAG: hypothetical protein JSU68_13580 [Phycisphaerales bacterium]
MKIESGTTRETLVRLGIVTLACLILCILFLRDGLVAWPRENAEYMGEKFPDPAKEPPSMNPSITEGLLDRIHKGDRLAKLEEELGEPSFNNDVEVFWVGKSGYIWAKLDRAGLVEQSTWEDAPHTRTDLQWQMIGAVITAVLTVIAGWLLIRAARTRVVLDDRGLVCNRGEPIEWNQMRLLDSSRYKRKGFVWLHYERGGQPGQQKLHSFHIARFKEIIGEICARKGFESPLEQPVKKKDAGDALQPPSA